MNITITEDFVTPEIAKLLRERKFDEVCWYFYTSTSATEPRRLETVPLKNSELKSPYLSCPTLQMAIKWLNSHNIYIENHYSDNGKGEAVCSCDVYVYNGKHFMWKFDTDYKKHEDSIKEVLEYTLEKLIKP